MSNIGNILNQDHQEVNGSYDKVNTLVQGQPYNSSRFSWNANANQNFILPAGFKLYLYAEYDSPGVNGLARMLSSSEIDAGANKTFWNKRATISFKAKDISLAVATAVY